MKVGFIGLGNMGAAMTANLLKAGHDLTVYNRTRARAEPLAAQGAKIAATAADACRGEVVFTMLSDDDAVESIVYGDEGVLATLAKGAIHVSSSTISVALAERLTAEHKQREQQFIAPRCLGDRKQPPKRSCSSFPRDREVPLKWRRLCSRRSHRERSSFQTSRTLRASSSSAAIFSLLP